MLYGRSPFLHDNPNMMFGKILEDEPSFPKEFKYSEESTDIIKKLLKKNGNERIGVEDEQEIFTHPWFNDIDFGKLNQKKLPALIIPHIDEDGPYKHFMDEDEEEESRAVQHLELSFEKDDKEKENKKAIMPMIAAAAVFPQRKTPDASFEDFSYFEEEEAVETPLQDDDRFLEDEWIEERRVQLLTNIEEGEDEVEERDALDSPKNEEEEASSPKNEKNEQPASEEKILKKKGSMELPDNKFISDEKNDHRTIDLANIPIFKHIHLDELKAMGPAVRGTTPWRSLTPGADIFECQKVPQLHPAKSPLQVREAEF
jgi:hypothetical protein